MLFQPLIIPKLTDKLNGSMLLLPLNLLNIVIRKELIGMYISLPSYMLITPVFSAKLSSLLMNSLSVAVPKATSTQFLPPLNLLVELTGVTLASYALSLNVTLVSLVRIVLTSLVSSLLCSIGFNLTVYLLFSRRRQDQHLIEKKKLIIW